MAETLRLYRSIATMDKKAPLPSLRSQKPTWDKAAALAKEWELKSTRPKARRAWHAWLSRRVQLLAARSSRGMELLD